MYAVAKAHMLCHAGRRAKSSANCQQRRDGFQPNKKELVLEREGDRKDKKYGIIFRKKTRTFAFI
jgi:hypothetical protein